MSPVCLNGFVVGPEQNYASKHFSLIGKLTFSKISEKMFGSCRKETRLKRVFLMCAGFVYHQVAPCTSPRGIPRAPTPKARERKSKSQLVTLGH